MSRVHSLNPSPAEELNILLYNQFDQACTSHRGFCDCHLEDPIPFRKEVHNTAKDTTDVARGIRSRLLQAKQHQYNGCWNIVYADLVIYGTKTIDQEDAAHE